MGCNMLVVSVILMLMTTVVDGGEILRLERAFPRADDGKKLSRLREMDRLRHASRFMPSAGGGVVDFPVFGDADLMGVYYTKLRLGSPPQEFKVIIDTGSDVTWVACTKCIGCPKSSLLLDQLHFFHPSNSSTVSAVSCGDQSCSQEAHYFKSGCSRSNQCNYTLQYGDGSGTIGFFLEDLMHFEKLHGNTTSFNSSAQVIFGCSTHHTGGFTDSVRAFDGIIGLGQQGLSVISQLSAHGVAPYVFSHCLDGGVYGGGILVFGPILEPRLVYTPLVPSRLHYTVNLESISVNGKLLPIRPSVLSNNQGGTIVDSGTTCAYLPQEAYQPLVDKVTQMVSPPARAYVLDGYTCYEVTSRISETFPSVQLSFSGGATMLLKPEHYLLFMGFGSGSSSSWCIGFLKSEDKDMTILGDLVLKDKIVVYDVANQRIGWADYDCSKHVNVLETNNTFRGRLKHNTALSPHDFYHWMASIIFILLLQLCKVAYNRTINSLEACWAVNPTVGSAIHIGDILEDFVSQRFGQERVDKHHAKKQAAALNRFNKKDNWRGVHVFQALN